MIMQLVKLSLVEKVKVCVLKSNIKEKKIKSIPLKVSAPFHCSLMKPASEKMKK